MSNYLPMNLPPIEEVLKNPMLIPGLRLKTHGWAENDGAVLVRRGGLGIMVWAAYYAMEFVRDESNDPR